LQPEADVILVANAKVSDEEGPQMGNLVLAGQLERLNEWEVLVTQEASMHI
jgi:hypothetical protein